MQRVAILGLGIMGGGMAANWLAKGFEVAVWNRTAAKAQALAGKGAKVAATPRDAAQGADFIFAMVADDDASRSVWLGADGALAGAKSGAVGVESSTLTPDWVRELGRHAEAKGCGFLDAPVGGSRAAAEGGELRFFVGGKPQTFEAARPALAAVGSKMDLLGPLGAGATWKLINNQLAAGQIAALAEALEVAKKGRLQERANLRAHPGRRPGEPDRQAQAAAHAGERFRAGGFRAQSDAEGRSLCGGARPVAGRARRHD
jgi:3-hydroxyisobutyrate dehydrogenase